MTSFVRKQFNKWIEIISNTSGDATKVEMHNSEDSKIYSIIIWKNPFISLLCLVIVNIVFWFIKNLNFKFYGILFTLLLVLAIEQLWTNQLSLFIFKKSESSIASCDSASNTTRIGSQDSCSSKNDVKRNRKFLRNVYDRAKHFRHTNPAAFCGSTCVCFLLLSIVGDYLSGVTSLYILLTLTLTVPGIVIHVLPSHIISSLSLYFCSSREGGDAVATDSDIGIESFLPETTQEALEVLRLAGEPEILNKNDDDETKDYLIKCIGAGTNDETESNISSSSFYPESSHMPSLEHSMEFLELDLGAGGSLASNSAYNENESIHFVSQHFDGDSSEEEFALDLPKKTITNVKLGALNKELTNENSKESNTNTINQSMKTNKKSLNDGELSSDTDSFELISEEDV